MIRFILHRNKISAKGKKMKDNGNQKNLFSRASGNVCLLLFGFLWSNEYSSLAR